MTFFRTWGFFLLLFFQWICLVWFFYGPLRSLWTVAFLVYRGLHSLWKSNLVSLIISVLLNIFQFYWILWNWVDQNFVQCMLQHLIFFSANTKSSAAAFLEVSITNLYRSLNFICSFTIQSCRFLRTISILLVLFLKVILSPHCSVFCTENSWIIKLHEF